MVQKVQDLNIFVSKPLLDGAGGVTGGPILHEDRAPCHLQTGLEMFAEDLAIHLGIHLLVLFHQIEAAELSIAKCPTNHWC